MTLSVRRPIILAALTFCLAVSAAAQVPSALLNQLEQANLTPAQQQALIAQLSPAERAALLRQLQPSAAQATPPAPEDAAADESALTASLQSVLADIETEHRLRAGDSLVLEFELPAQTDVDLIEFQERLADNNPYVLDRSGRLLLPGVPAISLAGLDVDEATIRIAAERELRPFDLTVHYLPLEPVGVDALEPFGYDLFEGPRSRFAPVTDIPVPVDYVIGPGDTLNVQLFGSQDNDYSFDVSRDGTINFPQIGPLTVAGLSISEVRELISEQVTESIIGATAITTLGELRSIQVFIVGEVEQPGSYTVSGLSTVSNGLFAGGGVKPIGSLRNIQLIREGNTVATLDLYELLLQGDTSNDLRLQPADVILVPTVGARIAVDGEIRRPGVYELNGENTITDIVALAGGLNATANQTTVKVERIVPGAGIAVTDLDLTQPADVQTTLTDGDVLRIEPNLDRLEASVRLEGNVQRPGIYQWAQGMTVSDLLPASDLVQPKSDLNYVLIRREIRPNIEIAALSLDLEAVWQGLPGAVDLTLQPRDTIYVFHLETGRQQYVVPLLDELSAQARPGEAVPMVRVGGQVRARGQYPLEPGMRVSDLLRAGGGLSDAAYAIEAELARYTIADGQFRQTDLIAIDLAALATGPSQVDIVLTPYDYLNIKEISGWRDQDTVTLRGEFIFPGEYPIQQGEMLSSLLARAGGLTDFAFAPGSVFTRSSLRERELEQLAVLAQRVEADLASLDLSDPNSSSARSTGQSLLNQLRNAEATGRLVIRLDDLVAGVVDADIVLTGGDELYVPEFRQEITVVGEVQYPTSHTFEAGLDRDSYLDRSGGLTERADDKRIYVVRANGEVIVNDGRRWFRRNEGVEIMPGDTIVAPIEVDRVRPLALWTGVTQVVYNLAIAAAAVNSF